jgi:hypothetical protein
LLATQPQEQTEKAPGCFPTDDMYEKQLQWMPWGMFGVYLKIAFRFVQFVLGIAIFGVYCADIVTATAHHASPVTAWLFACTVGGISATTAILYLLPCLHSYLFFWWDWVIIILHAGIMGVFGKAYITHKKPTENPKEFKIIGPDFMRERSTAYLDCVSGMLWLATAVMSTIIYLKIRRLKKNGAF